MKHLIAALLFTVLFLSCSSIDYSEAFMEQTSGRYLFNQDEVITVFYKNNDLYINWKGGNIKPVVLDETTFFVPDMYQKLRFVKQPETQKRFLGIVSEDDDQKVEFAYPKMADTFKTPRMYWRDKEYKEAVAGFLTLQKQDSTQRVIEEFEVNKTGYKLLSQKDFDNAITVLELNVELYPESDNAYDSLGDAYLRKGDSLQAYNNFKKAVELNSGNKRAKEFVEDYRKRK